MEGFLDNSLYFSILAEATSISKSPFGILAVANFLKGIIFGTLISFANLSAKSIPSPSTMISISFASAKGFSIKSRTHPPTKKESTLTSSLKSDIILEILANLLFWLIMSLIIVIL